MLNKNDPLIAAVQKVMQTNQSERDAVKVVNEKFGVTDRRALPRERQQEWDSAYAKVLTEGVEALDEKSFAALAPPYDKATQKDRLVGAGVLKKHPTQPGKHVLAKEEKKMKDDPCWDTHEMVGMKKKGGKEVPNCVPVKEEGDPSKAIRGDVVTGGSSVTTVPKPTPKPTIGKPDQDALKKKIQSVMEEWSKKQRNKQKDIADAIARKNPNMSDEKKFAIAGGAVNKMKKLEEAGGVNPKSVVMAKPAAAPTPAAPTPASREPNNKTGSTSGSGGIMRPLQQTRQNNMADTMNRKVRVDTAKKTGGAITGREDKWTARSETGNLKSYAPAPGSLGDKLKRAAGGGGASTPVPKRDAADSAPRPQPGADRLAAQKAGAAARNGSAPGSAPVNSSQPGSNKLFAQKAARDQSSKMGGGGTMGAKTPVPVPKAKPSVPGKKVVPAAGKTSSAPAPAVQNRPSALQRNMARARLNKSDAVGPEARKLQKIAGGGVTTGKTIVQKARPMAKRPIGMGREK